MNETEKEALRPGVRWWPAVVIVAVCAGLLAYNALRDTGHAQSQVIFTFPVLFFGALLLFLWAVLFSRLPGRTRRAVFLAVALVVAAGVSLFRIKGVDGNIVPILGFRWAGERSYGEAAATAAAVGTVPGGADYPQFYGPERTAVVSGPRLARDWEASPPRELWRHDVGEGWSAFAVAGDAAVTQEMRGSDEVVVRYELLTGREVWVHSQHAPFVTTVGGSGPRATPTIAGGRVYALGATGILSSIELLDGRLVWSRNILDDHGAVLQDWGMPSSPLVVGELVVVLLGRGGKSLAAYDRESGEIAWQQGEDQGSYSTPTLATVDGVEQILVVNQQSVAGHDPVSGERLWREPWEEGNEKVTPPLVLGEDRVLVSAGYGLGSRLLAVRRDAEGFAVEELWSGRRLKSKFASMVARDGIVYGLDDGILTAVEAATGERRWKHGRYGHGQMILVGDLLLIQAEDGDVVLVEARPDEHRELGRLEALGSKTWNPPALAGRYLLVRNNREAVCYELAVEG